MRLLNSRTLQMQEFIADDEISPYAILSHTWGDDEVSLLDMERSDVSRKNGFTKIQLCCAQALSDNLEWAWVDTCCIDKKSSAELSEAINSMYRWYSEATICYVFLADVCWTEDAAEIRTRLEPSCWFTRGWTLQELIAPKAVNFYSAEWRLMGTRSELTNELTLITGIDPAYLNGKDIKLASISRRMFWASNRKTTRTEDIAHCLLGIFDINMPLLYGEGKKAFRRLQEEILKSQPYEHTLFAWGNVIKPADVSNLPTFNGEKEFNEHGQGLWDTWDEEAPFLGLLAESPADFKDTGSFVPSHRSHLQYASPQNSLAIPVFMNNGLSVELPTYNKLGDGYGCVPWKNPRLVQLWARDTLVLLCHLEDSLQSDSYVLIPVWKGGQVVSRSRYLIHERLPVNHVLDERLPTRKKWFIAPQPRVDIELRTGDTVFLRPPVSTLAARAYSYWIRLDSRSKNIEWSQSSIPGFFRLRDDLKNRHIIFQWCFQQYGETDRGWIAIVYRKWINIESLGPLQISIVRVTWRTDFTEKHAKSKMDKVQWHDFPRRNTSEAFIAGPWPPDTDIPCCSHIMAIPKDSWELEAGRHMPVLRVMTEGLIMENGAVVDLIDFRAPQVCYSSRR